MADKAVVTQTTLDAIGQAIIDKGGATAAMTPAQMPAAIRTIGQKWMPPADWPDIRKVVDEDTHDYTDKTCFLMNITSADYGIVLSGAELYVFDDGTELSRGTKTFATTGLHWVLSLRNCRISSFVRLETETKGYTADKSVLWVCGNGNVLSLENEFYLTNTIRSIERCGIDYVQSNTAYPFLVGMRVIENLDADVRIDSSVNTVFAANNVSFGTINDLSRITLNYTGTSSISASGMFRNAFFIEMVFDLPSEMINNTYQMFQNCVSLKELPTGFSVPSATRTDYMFSDCISLVELPSGFSCAASTNTASMFSGCVSLRKLVADCNVIGDSFCSNCTAMKTVELKSDSILSFGGKAFSCSSYYGGSMVRLRIKSFVLHCSTPPTLPASSTVYVGDDCVFYVPQGSKSAYESAPNWSQYVGQFAEYTVDGDGVKWDENGNRIEV